MLWSGVLSFLGWVGWVGEGHKWSDGLPWSPLHGDVWFHTLDVVKCV